jgi:MinD-like ATPase involved in chromosome partitioning or flagellar assembly
VPLSVNRGRPLVLSEPKTEFSRVVKEIAKTVSTPARAQKPKRRFLALGRA